MGHSEKNIYSKVNQGHFIFLIFCMPIVAKYLNWDNMKMNHKDRSIYAIIWAFGPIANDEVKIGNLLGTRSECWV